MSQDREPPVAPTPVASSDSSGRSGPVGSGSGGGHDSRAGRARAGENVCVFWLGGERYALDAVLVREVIGVPSLLPVPLTPPWLIGLCNLRGVALAVVELGRVLDLRTAASPAPAHGSSGIVVLVLRAGGVMVGIQIDRVEAVYRFEAARLEPATSLDEHPVVKGLLSFAARGGFVATLLDDGKLAARLAQLKLRKSAAGAA